MKIAFDAQPLLDGTKSGVGFHEDGLIRNLLEQYPQNQYKLEYFSLRNHANKKKILRKYKKHNTQFISCKWFPGSLYRMISVFLPIPHHIFFHEDKQITHFFNYYVPPFVKGKKVVTIHDMAFRVFPETVRKKTLFFLKAIIKRSIHRADHIITVSEFSKQEIIRFYEVPQDKISVVPNGVDFKKFYPEKDKQKIENIKRKYNIFGEYFLYLGTLEPRKNLVRLMEAYAKARKENQNFPYLVLAGGKGWMYTEIFQKVEELNLKNNIVFTGYIEDNDVPTLMSGAMAFCFLSLYEGFGMPVIEAMACGVPVLTSNSSSLKEIAEGVALLVDETSIEDIKEGLTQLFIMKGLREELARKGIFRVKKYSWEKVSETLMNIYIDLVRK